MIVCWGDVGWDDYDGEDAPRPGGCALNVARSLALAGAEVACAGPVGEDGRALVDLMASWGVGVGAMEVLAGSSPRQRIRLGPGGERELCGHRGGVLSGYTPGQAACRALAEADLVYLPVFDTTLPWLDLLHTLREGPVAADLMDLSDVNEETVEHIVMRTRVVFAGLDVGSTEALDRLSRLAVRPGAALIVVTLGAAGSMGVDRLGSVHRPAVPAPGPVVDTTGCGDAYAGTFLAHWMRAGDVGEAMSAASVRAACVATHLGAVDALSE